MLATQPPLNLADVCRVTLGHNSYGFWLHIGYVGKSDMEGHYFHKYGKLENSTYPNGYWESSDALLKTFQSAYPTLPITVLPEYMC